jgi:hypothetical protein
MISMDILTTAQQNSLLTAFHIVTTGCVFVFLAAMILFS